MTKHAAPEARLPDVANVVEGVRVIDDLFAQPRVETNAGGIGMLLQGESAHAHFIEQPAWLYLEECEHPGESIIATLEGEWVLNAEGERRHMKPGSIFWRSGETTAGFEVPFDEPATILIFKSERQEESPEAYVEDLVERAPDACGPADSPDTFAELPSDHPAVEFARTVNDDFPR